MTFTKHFFVLIVIFIASVGPVAAQDRKGDEETIQQRMEKLNQLESTIEALHEKLFETEAQVESRGWDEEKEKVKDLLDEFQELTDDLRKKIHIERSKGTIGRAFAPAESTQSTDALKVPNLSESQELELMYFMKTRHPARYLELLRLYSKELESRRNR